VPDPANLATAPTALLKFKYELPPLILHPITPAGKTPPDASCDDAQNIRMEARRFELRMLCCLGKDLSRWLDQCLEFMSADPDLAGVGEAVLLDLLVENPPESVVRKMHSWGVSDFRAIFARALGLSAVFPHPPGREQVSDKLVRDLPRFADALYRARRQACPGSTGAPGFEFEVYASGEYAQMLERSWGL